jgi:hypothetical protein
MTLSNEKRRERYQNDVEYRNKVLEKARKKYNEDDETRKKKIKSAVEYGKSHIVDKKDYLKQYYKANCDHLKEVSKIDRDNRRMEVIYWYSIGEMKCECCGNNILEFLCIDHIDDNGHVHRNDMGMSSNTLNCWIVKNNFPFGFQILCNNCNYLKEYNRDKILSHSSHSIRVRNQRLNIRLQTLYWYSNGQMKCECCGENDDRLLTIDHMRGGGKQHLIDKGNKNLYEILYYEKYPEGYRVLCHNCNKSYGQYGYCPHC